MSFFIVRRFMKKKIDNNLKNKDKKRANVKWIMIVSFCAFVISLLLSLVSELVIPNSWIGINIILVLVFIFLGIIFDIIGVAVTTAKEEAFHSMATKKVNGARWAIKFIKNKEKVSSFCNDVIGDICGVVSGSCGLSIAIKFSSMFSVDLFIVTILVTSIISAMTIGGKAIGKSFAVNYSNDILYKTARFVSVFKKI